MTALLLLLLLRVVCRCRRHDANELQNGYDMHPGVLCPSDHLSSPANSKGQAFHANYMRTGAQLILVTSIASNLQMQCS